MNDPTEINPSSTKTTFITERTDDGKYIKVESETPLTRYDDLPDFPDVISQYKTGKTKWDHNNITYYIHKNGSQSIDLSSINIAFRTAFLIWSSVTPLTFTEAENKSQADMVISFEDYYHNDFFPFDGKGKTLAHAFFPPPNGELAGDSHYDDSETWTINSTDSRHQPIDLVTVAIHEIGHALGLDHSQDPDALMYPYYNGSHRHLDSDDIEGIQSLYGEPEIPKVDMIVGLQLCDNDKGKDTGLTQYTTSTGWTSWTKDSNGYDPDGLRLGLFDSDLNPLTAEQLKGIDFRFAIQLSDGLIGDTSKYGDIQYTPWASEGGGWSSWASDTNAYDFDAIRIKVETRQNPEFIPSSIFIGFQLTDGDNKKSSRGPEIFTNSGWSDWAGDGNFYDPDMVRIFAGAITEPSIKLGLQLCNGGAGKNTGDIHYTQNSEWTEWALAANVSDPDGIRLGLFDNELNELIPHNMNNIDFRFAIQLSDDGSTNRGKDGSIKYTPWASEGGGWSSWAGDSNFYDFDSVRVKVETRDAPGFTSNTLTIGVQLTDSGTSSKKTGPKHYSNSGWTEWTGDSNFYNPDSIKLFLGVASN